MEKSQNRKPFQALRDLFHPVDLTHGTCWRTILQFSLPVILSYLLQQVYTISDAAIVGQTLTAQEVAGVNDTASLVFIFLQFAFGVSAGFCVITSCCVGCRDQAGVRRSMAAQLVLSAGLTVLLTALALVLLNPMLAWINVTPENPEVYRAAYTYCGIIFAGIGAQLFYNFICSFLRSMGDSVTPLLFLLGSTVLNVALDLLFILVLHWGVAGVPGPAAPQGGLAHHRTGPEASYCSGRAAGPPVLRAGHRHHRHAERGGEVRYDRRPDGVPRRPERLRRRQQAQ